MPEVLIPQIGRTVKFDDSMSADDIASAIERDILPNVPKAAEVEAAKAPDVRSLAAKRLAKLKASPNYREATLGETTKSALINAMAGITEGAVQAITLPVDVGKDYLTGGPMKRGIQAVTDTLAGVPVKATDMVPPTPLTDAVSRRADASVEGARELAGIDPMAITDVGDSTARLAGYIAAPGPEILLMRKIAAKLPRAQQALDFYERKIAEAATEAEKATLTEEMKRTVTSLAEEGHTTPVDVAAQKAGEHGAAAAASQAEEVIGDEGAKTRGGSEINPPSTIRDGERPLDVEAAKAKIEADTKAAIDNIDQQREAFQLSDDELRAAARDNTRPSFANKARAEMKKRGISQKKPDESLVPIEKVEEPQVETPPPDQPSDVTPEAINRQKQLGAAFPAGMSADNTEKPPLEHGTWTDNPAGEPPPGFRAGSFKEHQPPLPDKSGYVPNREGYVSSDFASDFDAKRYVDDMTAEQEMARGLEKPGLLARGKAFYRDLKRTIVDYAAPIEDVLNRTVKEKKLTLAPSENITYQIDRVLRAPSIAGQFMRDVGFEDLIRKLGDDLPEFDQVLIARHARDIEATVFEAGDPVGVLNRATGDVDYVRLGSKEAKAAQAKSDQFFRDLIRRMARQTGRRMSAPDIETLAEQVAREHGLNLDAIPGARAGLLKIGKNTGRDLVQDEKLLAKVGNKYDAQLAEWKKITESTLDYISDSGLISQELAAKLKEIHPNYAPLNRIFDAAENGSLDFGTRPVASLSRQTVVQKLYGSNRAIESPIRSMLTKINDTFLQGERNKAAKMLVGYKDLPGNPFQLEEVSGHVPGDRTVSFLDDGKKRTFQTTPEVARAAKALNVQQLGPVLRMIAIPTRIARLGITGLNLPFLLTNVVRDQLTAFINADRGITAAARQQALASYDAAVAALSHGPLYEQALRQGAMGTSFDLSRAEIPKTVARIQSEGSVGRRIHYIVTHPGEWLRAAEDVVARGEEFTRLQQFAADYRARTGRRLVEDVTGNKLDRQAAIQAQGAAVQNTVNFARRGEWGSQMNALWLYLNANIQGTRQLMRSFRDRPVATAAKIGVGLLAPVGLVTAWNMSDPKRRFAYDDIAAFEKENNLILIPDNPTRDEQGKWNVVKIPISQEINNIMLPFRRAIEGAYGGPGVKPSEVAGAVAGTVSPINPTEGAALSTLTPQLLKPSLEVSKHVNKNIFTGANVVPDSLLRRPPAMQVKPGTSATAKEIGKLLNVSPLKVEFWIRETAGGVGSQGLNALDNAQAAAGIISPEEVGGESIVKGSMRRFMKAVGGEHQRRARSGGRE